MTWGKFIFGLFCLAAALLFAGVIAAVLAAPHVTTAGQIAGCGGVCFGFALILGMVWLFLEEGA